MSWSIGRPQNVLALHGVLFKPDDDSSLDQQHLPTPSESEVQRLLETICSRIERLLREWGLDESADIEEITALGPKSA